MTLIKCLSPIRSKMQYCAWVVDWVFTCIYARFRAILLITIALSKNRARYRKISNFPLGADARPAERTRGALHWCLHRRAEPVHSHRVLPEGKSAGQIDGSLIASDATPFLFVHCEIQGLRYRGRFGGLNSDSCLSWPSTWCFNPHTSFWN